MILITGGLGYIGSHISIELITSGYEIIVVDDLSNSSIECLKRIEFISGKKITFYQTNILDESSMRAIFKKHSVDKVFHLAGKKAVGESVTYPLLYYRNNIGGFSILAKVMQEFGCKNIVFSSSAAVYGNPKQNPIKESSYVSPTNPYSQSKFVIEEMLRHLYSYDNTWQIVILRYFNPIGAHKSGLIGDNPRGIPNNIMPCISQVAGGTLEKLKVFGDDYATKDGTGVRDYIHVIDLARGHIKAIEANNASEILTINLGTGKGYSVLDLISAFESSSGRKIPYEVVKRREGDVDSCYSDVSYAREKLGWTAQYDLMEMCEDTWRWQSKNLEGMK